MWGIPPSLARTVIQRFHMHQVEPSSPSYAEKHSHGHYLGTLFGIHCSRHGVTIALNRCINY